MQTAEKKQSGPSIGDQLSEAYRLLQEQQAREALVIIKDVKVMDPRNIYVLAFEKQVEQLIQFMDARTLTEDQRTDIMDSIPGIIERAIEGAVVDQLSAERRQRPAQVSNDDKAAALEWLKDQYFQHAHEYVQAGKYDHALAEIRRVHIIDPGNNTAMEFEKRIEHLAGLRSQPPAAITPMLRLVTRESLKVAERAEPEVAETPEPPASPKVEEPEVAPAKVEARPTHPAVREDRPAARTDVPEPRRGLRPAVLVLFLLLVIAAGATAYILWTRHQAEIRAAQRRSVAIAAPVAESFVGPSTTVDQRVFVLSSEDDAKSPTPAVEEEVPDQTESVAPSKPSRTTPKKDVASRSKRSPAKEKTAPKPAPKDESTPTEQNPAASASRQEETTAALPQVTEEASPSTALAEKQAEIIRLEPIKFSQTSAGSSLEGEASVRVQIDASGKPVATKVLSSSNPLIIQPVINAIMKSKFSPALMSSGPVSSWMTIPFKFKKR